mmetsp:Transcript_2852/g.11615  ORF Transcript_2852/g.11615 Transcript_2852/m.11615 type:complete len:228 (-) Transcript_2852:67-750(-)
MGSEQVGEGGLDVIRADRCPAQQMLLAHVDQREVIEVAQQLPALRHLARMIRHHPIHTVPDGVHLLRIAQVILHDLLQRRFQQLLVPVRPGTREQQLDAVEHLDVPKQPQHGIQCGSERHAPWVAGLAVAEQQRELGSSRVPQHIRQRQHVADPVGSVASVAKARAVHDLGSAEAAEGREQLAGDGAHAMADGRVLRSGADRAVIIAKHLGAEQFVGEGAFAAARGA